MNSNMRNPGSARLQMTSGLQALRTLLLKAKPRVGNPLISRHLPANTLRSVSLVESASKKVAPSPQLAGCPHITKAAGWLCNPSDELCQPHRTEGVDQTCSVSSGKVEWHCTTTAWGRCLLLKQSRKFQRILSQVAWPSRSLHPPSMWVASLSLLWAHHSAQRKNVP